MVRREKNNNSNFKIAVVVDMWITGFDVPSLAVMYIDKPLQKHTLIQTISRVNRVFDGKDKGLVVDYIGIKNDMLEAVKKYGSPQESPVDELNITLGIFRNHLAMIDELLVGFNATKFYVGEPLERLTCLNMAAEYDDLIEKYENPIEHACDMEEGQAFIANGWERPEGFCLSAWESMSAFVLALSHGGGDFYDGWMKNKKSAMISCNDGFRPVSFLIEALDEDAE